MGFSWDGCARSGTGLSERPSRDGESGDLPNPLTRWLYRHHVAGGLLALAFCSGAYVAWSAAFGDWSHRLVGLPLVGLMLWWHLRAQADVWAAWRRQNPGVQDRVRDRDVDESEGWLRRWDARNQAITEQHNEFGKRVDIDEMVSPMARRYFVYRGLVGLAVLLVGGILALAQVLV